MRFIIPCYGVRLIGMLASLLFSICRTNPSAGVTVLLQDVPIELMTALKMAYPLVEFYPTNLNLSEDRRIRISSKPILLRLGYLSCDDGETVLMDADMLVTGDIAQYFQNNNEWDIGITHKPEEIFPLNSGVILLRRREGVIRFLEQWVEVTLQIFDDPKRMAIAHSSRHPYGGADQMSLYEILSYDRTISDYLVDIKECQLRVHAFPCLELNQTKSAPLAPETKIVHYKAGWQRVLLDGFDFSQKRPRKDSWPMYIFYLRTFQQAVNFIHEKSGITTPLLFNSVKLPFYLNSHLEERKGVYPIFAIWSRFRWRALSIARAFCRKFRIQYK